METVLRVGLIYVFLMITLRVLGKREFSQLAPFELVTLLMIPELVAQALVREDFSMTNAIVAVCTLLSLVFLTSIVAFRSRRAARLIEGSPSVLVRHGFLVPDAMALERVSPGEVLNEMHKSGLETMPQVKWAVLETDGKITIVPWHTAGQAQVQEKEDVT
jgi:uncharacterized membrane protein YcaP (DUF421 family)